MSEEHTDMATSLLREEQVYRAQIFHVLLLVSAAAGVPFLLFSILSTSLLPQFPSRYMTPVTLIFILSCLIGIWLIRRGLVGTAFTLYVPSVTGGMFAGMYFLGGASSPLTPGLAASTMVAGLVAGSRAGIFVALLNAVLYVILAVLEANGLIHPWEIPGGTVGRIVEAVGFLSTLGVTVGIVGAFAMVLKRIVTISQERTDELALTSKQARQAAQAERAVREREEQTARQLRMAIREYTAFLERVRAGDYSARLELTGMDKSSTGELHALGQHINDTVESLVNALNSLQTVQRRYARAAWEHYTETQASHRGFRYNEKADVEVTDQAWLSPMAEAVIDKDVQVTGRQMALPLTLRGEVIGALGVRRGEERDWTEEDLALAQAITDQLTQTIESLRLLDETQRNAAREQTLSDLTARFARSLDMDALLHIAVRELGLILPVDEISVHIGAPPDDLTEGTHEQPDSQGQDEERNR